MPIERMRQNLRSARSRATRCGAKRAGLTYLAPVLPVPTSLRVSWAREGPRPVNARRSPRACALLLVLAACGGTGGGGAPPSLSDLATERLRVDEVDVEAWIARTPAEQARGLMDATEADLAPLPDGTPRAMLFDFPTASYLSFWMHGTAVPLDLAYARADGTIVEVHDLVPFDETPVVAGEPVVYALEALAGTFVRQGIGPGSVIAR